MPADASHAYERRFQSVVFGNASSGITLSYTKRTGKVHVSGWYDHMVGIEGGDIDLTELLAAFGVPPSKLRHVASEV